MVQAPGAAAILRKAQRRRAHGRSADPRYATDFASIPRLFWSRLPHDGDWAKASVVHDYFYNRGGCSRFLADAVFRDGMAALGVPLIRRMAIYYAVRLFGWRYWRAKA